MHSRMHTMAPFVSSQSACCRLAQPGHPTSFSTSRARRAADNLLRRTVTATLEPDEQGDLLYSSDEITAAVADPVLNESQTIAVLRSAGWDRARLALNNGKKTVRRQQSRQVPLVAEVEELRDEEFDVDWRVLLGLATSQQRAVLQLRLRGQSNEEIANCLGTTKNRVAVLCHRGVERIRQHLASAASKTMAFERVFDVQLA